VGAVIVDLSVSLDGYIAGPDDGQALPLGRGGEGLFAWMSAGPESNRQDSWMVPPEASRTVVNEWKRDCGAMISGRRTFEIANGWKSGHPIDVPNFILTHEPPSSGEWSPRCVFVSEGLDRALQLAKQAVGDKNVSVCGADPAQQLLRTGQLDEIQVSVVPLLLGGGVRLFEHLGTTPIELEQTRVIASVGVTHLRYRVRRS
jgi:dihydrofolate reductase